MKFALGIVISGKDSRKVWEDVAATLGDNNNLLEDGHSCVFVGGPYPIAEADEYDSLDVGQTIMRVEFGREPVPVKDTPDPIFTVDVPMRNEGLYVFADHGAAAAFADAVTVPDTPSEAGVDDPPVNVGKGAEDLIASERAALIEDAGLPTVAEDVREHMVGLETLLIRLSSIPDTTEARGLLGHWIEVDAERAIPEDARPFNRASADSVEEGDWIALDSEDKPHEPRKVKSTHTSGVQIILCFADDDPPAKFNYDEPLWHRVGDPEEARAEDDVPKTEPAYTVIGLYAEPTGRHESGEPIYQTYATAVYTHGGVGAAEALAQAACREDNDAETGDDLLRIVGVIPGEHDVQGGEA